MDELVGEQFSSAMLPVLPAELRSSGQIVRFETAEEGLEQATD